jgi:3'-phosphoadenosine 5'-phosphosulfate (PAPS) 3'-phosphatase
MMRVSMGLLEEVEVIAREAGAAIMGVYARDFSVWEKEDKSPLTEADAAAHEVTTRRLERLQLALPILSEEAAGDFSGADTSGRYWLVDPLDDTKEFIKRNGEFMVNIALIEDGRSILVWFTRRCSMWPSWRLKNWGHSRWEQTECAHQSVLLNTPKERLGAWSEAVPMPGIP